MKNITKLLFTIMMSMLNVLFFVQCDKSKRLTTECLLAPPYCKPFPLNSQNTTPYGPPWANVTTEFLPCFGPYALCYYADCTAGSNDTVSNCPCQSMFGLNFVNMSSILNNPVYEETVRVCNADPERCSLPNGAPVCTAINNGTFYKTAPGVVAVSDFSFAGFTASAAIGTNCATQPGVYSGCMTSACYTATTDELNCICPTFNGPFQVGQQGVSCDIQPLTYSAAFNPNEGTNTPTPPSNINCFPDAGANAGNPIACPLYNSTTTLPSGSDVNCAKVCNEYDTCLNSGVQIGYTCDTTLCTTEKKDIYFPACSGLQNCNISEIMKAEFAAGCSCCGSQLCNCKSNKATNKKIRQYNAAQVANGDTPQCEQNGTLCGF